MEASFVSGDDSTMEDNIEHEAFATGRWVSAFESMKKEAISMGIPASAMFTLPQNPCIKDIRKALEMLSGIIASYLSANL